MATQHNRRFAIAQRRLGLDPLFIGSSISCCGNGFMGQHPLVSVLPDAQNLAVRAQATVGSIEEHISFESARGLAPKPCCLQKLFQGPLVPDAKLNFSLDAAHRREYT